MGLYVPTGILSGTNNPNSYEDNTIIFRMDKRNRPLTASELQELADNIDEESSDFDSDDSVEDKDFIPSAEQEEESCDSDSSDQEPITEPEESCDSDYSDQEQTAEEFESENQVNAGASQNENMDPQQSNTSGYCLWSNINSDNFFPRFVLPDKESPIITADLHRGSTVLDCFLKVFPRSLFIYIAQSTNRRLEILEQNKKKIISKTCDKEIMLLTGVTLIMHYNRVPSFAMYWSNNRSLGNECVRNAISRDRCQLLLSKLYFIEPNKPMEGTKTYYMDDLISCLKNSFMKARTDSTYQAIDESMAKYKGRSALKQYMPLKPIKRGIKLWTRCDSETGYVYDVNIYAGKDNTNCEGTLGERVVYKLASTISRKSVVLCFDRFFTSVSLMDNIKFAAVGTCIKTRKFLPKFEGKLRRGSFQTKGNENGTLAVRWQDTKDFIVLSNCHSAGTTTVSRKQKDGTTANVTCPESIAFYNRYMGGVDLADQMTALYDLNRKSQKWWKKVYYKLLMIAVHNSYIIYGELNPKNKKTFLQYLVELAENLIAAGRQGTKRRKTKQVGRRSKAANLMTNVGDHLPVTGKSSRLRCVRCTLKKTEKRTKFICKMCNVPLCADCFTPYHL